MKSLRYVLLFGLAILLFSCNKFKGSQEIPAYVRITPWTFTTNYQIEGAATEAITSSRLHVDGSLIGTFDYKNHDDGQYVMIPVLNSGEHNIQVLPVINLNGISSTKVNYPFYKTYQTKVTLTPGEYVTVSPSTTYYSVDSTNMCFKLMEDFENVNNIQFDADTNYAKVKVVSVKHSEDNNAWVDPLDSLNHCRSGHIHLGDSLYSYRIWTDKLTDIPSLGNKIILEIDYKCTSDFCVGLFYSEGINQPEYYPLVYLRATDVWKKNYVNLSPIFNENPNLVYTRVYLQGDIAENSTADYYFDNIKLIYR